MSDDPECDVRHYDYSVYGEAVELDKEPHDCRACGGTGKVLLLVSARSCEACEGTGKLAADGAPDPAAAGGTWNYTYTYDRLGDLVGREKRFVPDTPPLGPHGTREAGNGPTA
jgi:hypothetical protein